MADDCCDDCGCTLDPVDIPARVEQWRAVTSQATNRTRLDDGIRLTFPSTPATAGELAALAAAEADCCSFFRFTIEVTPQELTFAATAPAAHLDTVHRLFG